MAKGKDPAILWYWSDWNSGTTTFSRHLKGCYMDLLHAQFNSGHLSLEEIKTVLGVDFSNWNTLQKKFKSDSSGLFYNERLDSEMIKRRDFSQKQRENALKRFGNAKLPARSDTKILPLENGNEDANENAIGNSGEGSAEGRGMSSPELADARFVYAKQSKEFQDTWNKFAVKHKLAQVQLIPQYRLEIIVRCIKNPVFDLQKVLSGLEKQKWGLTDEWKATFDKVFGDESFWVKCIEANTLTTEQERVETENYYICEACGKREKRTNRQAHRYNCSAGLDYWIKKDAQPLTGLLP